MGENSQGKQGKELQVNTVANVKVLKSMEFEFSPAESSSPRESTVTRDLIPKRIESALKLPDRGSSSQFIGVLTSIILARSVFVVLAEANNVSALTFLHFVTIFIPLALTTIHFEIKYKVSNLWKYAIESLQLVILIGLGSILPSTFSSTNDTLSNFVIFLCLARCLLILCNITTTKLNSLKELIKSVAPVAPVILWLICFLQSNSTNFYIIFSTGVLLDVMVELAIDLYFGIRKVSRSKSIYIISACCYYIFESRVLAEYADSITSVPFNYLNFITATLAVLLLSSVGSLISLCTSADSLVRGARTMALVKWANILLQLSSCLFTSAIAILVYSMYSPLLVTPQLPVNLYLAQIALISTKSGVDFLARAATVAGIVPYVQSNSYLMLVFVALGLLGFSLALLHWTITRTRLLGALMVVFLSISAISFSPIPWYLVSPSIVFYSVFSLLFLTAAASNLHNK